jgi:hypothetical protein
MRTATGWTVYGGDLAELGEQVTAEEMSDAIGARWVVDSFAQETEQQKKKREKVESAVESAKERKAAREEAHTHFREEQERVQEKHGLDDAAWEEIKKVMTNPDPYVFDGRFEQLVIHAIPGGWKQLVCRRAVHDAFGEPMERVAVAAKAANEIAERKVKAAEEKNAIAGKKRRRKGRRTLAAGCGCSNMDRMILEMPTRTTKP